MDKIIDFYDRNLKKHQNSFKSAAWGSRKSQEKRFDLLCELADFKNSSILDVGCGIGDFYGWARRKRKSINYTGIDITPSAIELAKNKYPGVDFYVKDIHSIRYARTKYDYVIASGIFNRKVGKHYNFVSKSITNMFKLCNKGIAFNIMSNRADFMQKDEYYADPGRILDFCLKISRKTILRHDYMPHDFTIYMYKDKL